MEHLFCHPNKNESQKSGAQKQLKLIGTEKLKV
jgi:hypothetical protein